MQSTLKILFWLSPNFGKIKPEFVPKIKTLLGYFDCAVVKLKHLIRDEISTSFFKNLWKI